MCIRDRDTVTPEGSEVLVEPKNHSNVGEDTLAGRGLGEIIAEHFRAKLVSPAIILVLLEPEKEMVTALMSTEICKKLSKIIIISLTVGTYKC